LWSAIFLGIGSMVGAGIFVLLGEAGAIAGNLVWISFIFGGVIALLSGYSLAKLATLYPSRGGIVEYLVQCYGEGVFSGSVSILFYLSAMVAIAMVAKTFGTYASMIMDTDNSCTGLYGIIDQCEPLCCDQCDLSDGKKR
jgi:amino acid transporter